MRSVLLRRSALTGGLLMRSVLLRRSALTGGLLMRSVLLTLSVARRTGSALRTITAVIVSIELLYRKGYLAFGADRNDLRRNFLV